MSMKEAFDICFKKQKDFWNKQFGNGPKCPYSGNKISEDDLFIEGTIDNEGYAEWKPKLQTQTVDFETIENELGFKLHLQLKEYFSTYWFMNLVGRINDITVYFKALPCKLNVETAIKESYINPSITEECKISLNDVALFNLGTVDVAGNDSYTFCFDNNTAEVMYIDFVDSQIRYAKITLEELMESLREVF